MCALEESTTLMLEWLSTKERGAMESAGEEGSDTTGMETSCLTENG